MACRILISTRVVRALTSIRRAHQSQTHVVLSWRSFSRYEPVCSTSSTYLAGLGPGVAVVDDGQMPDMGFYDIAPEIAAVKIPIGSLPVLRSDRRYFVQDDAPEEKLPDFSILVDDSDRYQHLTPEAIKRGQPTKESDVWVVNHKWTDLTGSPLPDPCGVIQSDEYRMQLAQVLYATNSVTLRRDEPVVKEDIEFSKMPFSTVTEGTRTGCINSAIAWKDCCRIQHAMMENWRDARGRSGLQALMGKANLVCEMMAYDALGTYGFVSKIQQQRTQVESVGGISYFDGGCTVAYAALDPEYVIQPTDSIEKISQKKEILKAKKTWSLAKDTFTCRQYTPDVYCASHSPSFSCITGEVKSQKPIQRDIQRAWIQSLKGLQNKEKTYAVVVSPKEAMIAKVEVEDGDTLNTYTRHYFPLINNGALCSEVIEKFFHDLVLAIWDNNHSE